MPARADTEAATPGGVGFGDGRGTVDDEAAGREVRAGHMLQHLRVGRFGLVDQQDRGARTVRRHCAAGCWSPCRPQCRPRHWRAGSGTGPGTARAPAPRHYRSDGNRRRPRRGRPSGRSRPESAAPRCSDRPRRYRRRYCRNCPARRPAGSACAKLCARRTIAS